MQQSQDELRALYRRYCDACDIWSKAWEAQGYIGEPPPQMPYPEELRGLTCGAKTRSGHPCKRTDLYRSGRCKFHGGMSTGPRKRQKMQTP